MNNENQVEKYEWLFIFIIYADYGKENHNLLIEDPSIKIKDHIYYILENIKLTKRCKIAVILNQIKDLDKTFFSHVVNNGSPKNKQEKIEDLTCTEELLVQKPDLLGKRIGAITEKFPAEKHCILTFDHGSLFGINKTTNRPISPNSDIKRDYSIYKDQDEIAKKLETTVNKLLQTTKEPEWFEILTADELSKAILTGLGKKAELVIMCNCCMQSIMTQYALRNAAEYLVAPLGLFTYPGYNFEPALNAAFKQPTEAEDLISILCNSFYNDNVKYTGTNIKVIDRWSVSGIKLDYLQSDFINQLNELTAFFIKYLRTEILKGEFYINLKNALSYLIPYDKPNSSVLFDLAEFLLYVKREMEGSSEELVDLIDKMLSLFPPKKAEHTFVGKKLANRLSGRESNFADNGLTILLPGNNDSFIEQNVNYFLDPINRNQVLFFESNNVLWSDFISKFNDLLKTWQSIIMDESYHMLNLNGETMIRMEILNNRANRLSSTIQ